MSPVQLIIHNIASTIHCGVVDNKNIKANVYVFIPSKYKYLVVLHISDYFYLLLDGVLYFTHINL